VETNPIRIGLVADGKQLRHGVLLRGADANYRRGCSGMLDFACTIVGPRILPREDLTPWPVVWLYFWVHCLGVAAIVMH